MNDRKSLYDIKTFYDKDAVLKASFQGMRYQLQAFEPEEGEKLLQVTIWPEPFSFEKTPEEQKTTKAFPYDEAGLDQAYDWLCEMHEAKKVLWKKDPFDIL